VYYDKGAALTTVVTDTLYTPPGWWHYVESLTASASLLVPFDPNMSTEKMPFNVVNC
jgi:hypothetical protein